MKKKRIKVIEFSPTMKIGGAENVVRSICKHLNTRKFDLKLISMYRSCEGEWPKHIRKYCLDKKGPGASIKIFFKLLKLLRQERPQIIHLHYQYSLLYLIPANYLASRAIIVQTIHNNLDHYQGQNLWRAIFKIFKIHTVNLSARLNPKLQNSSNINIANGVDIRHFSISKSINYKKILFLGRLEKQKNPLLALDIFKLLLAKNKEIYCTLAGTGSMQEEIKKKSTDIPANRFCFINKKVDTASYFKQNGVLLLTSRYEGMPLTVIEAMAAGLIVFANQVDSIKDLIIDGYNGFLLPQGAADRSAKYIAKKLATVDLQAISHNARASAIRLSDKAMTRNYEKYFIDLLTP